MPLTWPVGHLASAILKPQEEKVAAPQATSDLDLIGQYTVWECVLFSHNT